MPAGHVSDSFIERGLNHATDLGVLHSWLPIRSGPDQGARWGSRKWLLVFPDGSTETMAPGAAWGFCLGVTQIEQAASGASVG